MDLNEEVVIYLESLMDHYHGCTVENCPRCAVMLGACAYVRNRIFSTVICPAAAPGRPVRRRYATVAHKGQ